MQFSFDLLKLIRNFVYIRNAKTPKNNNQMKLTNQQTKSLLMVLPDLRKMIKTGTSPPFHVLNLRILQSFHKIKIAVSHFKQKSIVLYNRCLK